MAPHTPCSYFLCSIVPPPYTLIVSPLQMCQAVLFSSPMDSTLYSGWCGEVRDVIYTNNGKVAVVYRVTVR
jgi:hypothetical protein